MSSVEAGVGREVRVYSKTDEHTGGDIFTRLHLFVVWLVGQLVCNWD